MLFFLLLVLAFIGGLFVGKPTAPYYSPRNIGLIIAIMSPFILLYFFSEHQIANDIRYLYAAFVLGLFGYWTYDQTRQKMS